MADVPKHNFEVKFLLDTHKVLKTATSNELTAELKTALNVSAKAEDMSIQFIDTNSKQLSSQGWNLRVRRKKGKKIELTYKKRYDIAGPGDISTAGNTNSIDTALSTAQQDGFDLSGEFEAQVEVGYAQQTLSVSNGQKVSDAGFGELDLPTVDQSRQLLADQAPAKFKAMSNAMTQLGDSSVYGPVSAKRWEGKFDGYDLDIELWKIRKSTTDSTLEPIVEASFKADTFQEVLEGRASMTKFLKSSGWLLQRDSLKTKLVMDRYAQDTTSS